MQNCLASCVASVVTALGFVVFVTIATGPTRLGRGGHRVAAGLRHRSPCRRSHCEHWLGRLALPSPSSRPSRSRLGIFWSCTRAWRDNLSFVASLNSSRIGALAAIDNTSWHNQRARIAELIELPGANQHSVRQRVYDSLGLLAVENGDPLNAPTLMRSTSIVAAGATVGRIEVETSLRGLIYDTGLAAGLSLVLGFAVYFAVRILPLKVLYQTFDKLEVAQRQLQEYHDMQFDAALNNMSQGLCMFNADGRLTTINRRFADIFKVPSEAITSGMTVSQIMDTVHSLTDITEDNPDLVLSKLNLLVSQHERGTITFNRTDGRVISTSHQPMADGGWVETFDDITDQRLAEAKLSYMAQHDMLTGLPNRLSFYEQLETRLAQVTRSGHLALFSLDLDHFKNVNDTLGHPIGDKLLQAVAERLRDCVRKDDLVARLGGDEFALVQIDADGPNTATTLASRLIEIISAPYELDGHQVVVGTSVGVALGPNDGTHPDGLTKNADLAMYRAKADGGNTYRFFEPETDALMQARREIELDLRKAIVNEEFELHYQPLINLEAGKVTCFEALVRWRHPERGHDSADGVHPDCGRDGPDRRSGAMGAARSVRRGHHVAAGDHGRGERVGRPVQLP